MRTKSHGSLAMDEEDARIGRHQSGKGVDVTSLERHVNDASDEVLITPRENGARPAIEAGRPRPDPDFISKIIVRFETRDRFWREMKMKTLLRLSSVSPPSLTPDL